MEEKKMTLEEYKKAVEENLLRVSCGKKLTAQIMKDYENDFQEFLNEGYSVAATTAGVINYFL